MQTAPETHWLSFAHPVRQEVDPQLYEPQLCMTGFGQLPAPSQPAASVCEPPEQLADLQLLDEPGNTQDGDDPSQVLAQVPLPVQEPCPLRGAPEMVAQVPGVCPEVVSAHAWQVPLQALLQQTPSAQKLLVH